MEDRQNMTSDDVVVKKIDDYLYKDQEHCEDRFVRLVNLLLTEIKDPKLRREKTEDVYSTYRYISILSMSRKIHCFKW